MKWPSITAAQNFIESSQKYGEIAGTTDGATVGNTVDTDYTRNTLTKMSTKCASKKKACNLQAPLHPEYYIAFFCTL